MQKNYNRKIYIFNILFFFNNFLVYSFCVSNTQLLKRKLYFDIERNSLSLSLFLDRKKRISYNYIIECLYWSHSNSRYILYLSYIVMLQTFTFIFVCLREQSCNLLSRISFSFTLFFLKVYGIMSFLLRNNSMSSLTVIWIYFLAIIYKWARCCWKLVVSLISTFINTL